ncbi:MAG: flagellin [Clostridia bacterium]|nr:flagellin [Clostridia bacterium]
MRINHNLSALNAWKNLVTNDDGQNKTLEKLSSGVRIGRAADDAAGLSISEKMRGQIKGLNQASRNAQDGISLLQTAEGALGETHSILQRMRELAVQSASDTVTDSDRAEIQKEVNALRNEADRISTDTEFNTQKLLEGNFTNKTVHIGANADQSLKVNIGNMDAKALSVDWVFGADASHKNVFEGKLAVYGTPDYTGFEGAATAKVVVAAGNFTVQLLKADGTDVGAASASTAVTATVAHAGLTFGAADTGTLKDGDTIMVDLKGGVDVSTQSSANAAITKINDAINTVSGERSKLGAIQNRLDHTIANLATSSENLTAAESRIRDVDIAVEMMSFTKYQILSQASTAMLAQANQKPQAVLQLLR